LAAPGGRLPSIGRAVAPRITAPPRREHNKWARGCHDEILRSGPFDFAPLPVGERSQDCVKTGQRIGTSPATRAPRYGRHRPLISASSTYLQPSVEAVSTGA